MSHSIPIFICLIDPIDTPSRLSSWKDAVDLISDCWNKLEQEGKAAEFVESTSRNWWHQHLLRLMCHAYGIKGLEFTAQEIACLRNEELLAGDVGLSQLFQIFEAQRLSDMLDMFGVYSDILDQDYLTAFRRAEFASKIEAYDSGFKAAVSFFIFLKSLKAMLVEAYQTNKFLLYIMPDFNDVGGSFEAKAN